MRFRQFVRDALLAPGGVRLPQCDDLIGDHRINPSRLLWGRRYDLIEARIARRVKARFPIVEKSL
jgi:hypothetical protein